MLVPAMPSPADLGQVTCSQGDSVSSFIKWGQVLSHAGPLCRSGERTRVKLVTQPGACCVVGVQEAVSVMGTGGGEVAPPEMARW